ncbi:MspA family porin [Nocardia sp. 2YAB30]|uniref:MspA family porin n=1 Tax=unclassified Nocardia TaxID=2637762 RepID=UPI003F9A4888
MNRKHSRALAVITAVMVAAGAGVVGDTAAGAEPGEINSRGLHLIASVDSNNAVSAGGDTPFGIPLTHAVKVSGDFSVLLDGVSSLRSGKIAVGYLIGCAVDLSNGITIGIAPSAGINASITPFFGLDSSINLAIDAPPSISIGTSVGVSPSVGVNAGAALALQVTLAPGSVTAAVIGEADLDKDATFPYTFAHTNTPLNVSSCLPQASAIPFVTVRADATNGTAQTTGYGAQFVF